MKLSFLAPSVTEVASMLITSESATLAIVAQMPINLPPALRQQFFSQIWVQIGLLHLIFASSTVWGNPLPPGRHHIFPAGSPVMLTKCAPWARHSVLAFFTCVLKCEK